MAENFSIHQFHEEIKKNHIVFAFKGVMAHSILHNIAENLKRKAFDKDTAGKKIFAIFIELAQNIHHYSAERMIGEEGARPSGSGTISISEADGFYVVSSGNLVDKEKVTSIVKKVAYINTLDDEQLKQYYKEQRKLISDDKREGGNVGFIDIRRKSGNPIGILVDEVDQNNSFLTISVKINKEKIQ